MEQEEDILMNQKMQVVKQEQVKHLQIVITMENMKQKLYQHHLLRIYQQIIQNMLFRFHHQILVI